MAIRFQIVHIDMFYLHVIFILAEVKVFGHVSLTYQKSRKLSKSRFLAAQNRTLRETNSSHLRIGNPKKELHLPTSNHEF